ncbi:MAG: hypothetical protein AABY22_21175 [Nanoarchaeota archaeon]
MTSNLYLKKLTELELEMKDVKREYFNEMEKNRIAADTVDEKHLKELKLLRANILAKQTRCKCGFKKEYNLKFSKTLIDTELVKYLNKYLMYNKYNDSISHLCLYTNQWLPLEESNIQYDKGQIEIWLDSEKSKVLTSEEHLNFLREKIN